MLTWNWNDACGVAVIKQGENIFKMVIRPSNGLWVMHYQYTEDGEERAQLISFAVDKAHMKRCAEDGIFEDCLYVTFYKGCKDAEKLAKAFIDCGVTTYYEVTPLDPPFKIKWDLSTKDDEGDR